MIEKFLKAKHWQVFLLTFGLPFVLQIFTMSWIFSSVFEAENPDPAQMLPMISIFPLLGLVFIAIQFSWNWSVVMGLDRIIPPEYRLNLRAFRVFFFIPMIYALIFSLSFLFLMNDTYPNPIFLLVVIPVHLFSMFCIVYCSYIVAKSIRTAEEGQTVHFSDYVAEFFMLWFFPIGVWLLQPRINQLAERIHSDF